MGCALKLESYYENQHDWSFFEEKQRTEYKYDPVGRRIIRSVVDNVDLSKSKTQKYYYDGSNILAELDADNNLIASYTHSPLRPDDVLGAKFTDYAAPVGAISEGQVLAQTASYVYYLKDHLNTINEITNANGDIIQKMDYSAFGVLRSVKDSGGNEVGFENAPVRTSFTYTGREFEPELNMYYYRARYYDPSTGRFLQKDPDPGKLADPSTFLSKYIYAANSPAMFSDPSGQIVWVYWLAVLAVAAFNGYIQADQNRKAAALAGKDKDIQNSVANSGFWTGFLSVLTGAIFPSAAPLISAIGSSANNALLQNKIMNENQSINWGSVLFSGLIGYGFGQIGNGLTGITPLTTQWEDILINFITFVPANMAGAVLSGPKDKPADCGTNYQCYETSVPVR